MNNPFKKITYLDKKLENLWEIVDPRDGSDKGESMATKNDVLKLEKKIGELEREKSYWTDSASKALAHIGAIREYLGIEHYQELVEDPNYLRNEEHNVPIIRYKKKKKKL